MTKLVPGNAIDWRTLPKLWKKPGPKANTGNYRYREIIRNGEFWGLESCKGSYGTIHPEARAKLDARTRRDSHKSEGEILAEMFRYLLENLKEKRSLKNV